MKSLPWSFSINPCPQGNHCLWLARTTLQPCFHVSDFIGMDSHTIDSFEPCFMCLTRHHWGPRTSLCAPVLRSCLLLVAFCCTTNDKRCFSLLPLLITWDVHVFQLGAVKNKATMNTFLWIQVFNFLRQIIKSKILGSKSECMSA